MGWLTANVEGNQNSGLHFMFRFESVCQFCVLKIHTHAQTGSEWTRESDSAQAHRLRTAFCWLKTHISIELEERAHTHARRLTDKLESDCAQAA